MKALKDFGFPEPFFLNRLQHLIAMFPKDFPEVLARNNGVGHLLSQLRFRGYGSRFKGVEVPEGRV